MATIALRKQIGFLIFATGRVSSLEIADDAPLMIGTQASHNGSLHCGEVTQLLVTLAIKVHLTYYL